MVEHDVGDAGNIPVAGNRNGGKNAVFAADRVDGNNSFDGALLEKEGIFFDEIAAMAMTDDKVKITFLKEMIFDARHDQRGVAFADFRNNYADGETALLAERTSHEVGTIVEFAGGLANPFLSSVGNGLGSRGAIDDQGNGCGREIQVFRKSLEADGTATIFRAIFGLGMIGRGHRGVLAGSLSQGRRQGKRVKSKRGWAGEGAKDMLASIS